MGLVAEASRASSSLARWDCACSCGQNLANFGRLEEYLDYEYLRYLLESRSAIAMIGYGWMCEEKLYAIWPYGCTLYIFCLQQQTAKEKKVNNPISASASDCKRASSSSSLSRSDLRLSGLWAVGRLPISRSNLIHHTTTYTTRIEFESPEFLS